MLPITSLSCHLVEAMQHLAAKDDRLAELIQSTQQFQLDEILAESPYEALLEAIAYQSISGKAAATICGRVKAPGAFALPVHLTRTTDPFSPTRSIVSPQET
jgi:3-methyladenine DNA glycosylase/8-oxoguanine DNA glycosylase